MGISVFHFLFWSFPPWAFLLKQLPRKLCPTGIHLENLTVPGKGVIWHPLRGNLFFWSMMVHSQIKAAVWASDMTLYYMGNQSRGLIAFLKLERLLLACLRQVCAEGNFLLTINFTWQVVERLDGLIDSLSEMTPGIPASQRKCSLATQGPCKCPGGKRGIAVLWHVVPIKSETGEGPAL